jgi:hypothetical protein
MEILPIEERVAPTTPSSSIVEAVIVSPPEVDKGCHQNVDGRQEAKYHYNQRDLEAADPPVDELQELDNHHTADKLKAADLPVNQLQEPEDHRETDKLKAQNILDDGRQDPKVPKLSLDNGTPQRSYNYRITKALKALADNSICLVEYGAQVQFRCGYEEVPVVSELESSTMIKGRLY